MFSFMVVEYFSSSIPLERQFQSQHPPYSLLVLLLIIYSASLTNLVFTRHYRQDYTRLLLTANLILSLMNVIPSPLLLLAHMLPRHCSTIRDTC